MKYTLLGTVVPEMVRTEKKPEVGRVREAGGTAVSQQELRAGCLTFYSKDKRGVKRALTKLLGRDSLFAMQNHLREDTRRRN